MFNTTYLNYIPNFILLQKFTVGGQIDLLIYDAIASEDTRGRGIVASC